MILRGRSLVRPGCTRRLSPRLLRRDSCSRCRAWTSRTTSRRASRCSSFIKPAAQASRRDPRAARGDARRQLSAARARAISTSAACHATAARTPRASGSPATSTCTRTTPRSATRRSSRRACRCPRTVRSRAYDSAVAHADVGAARHGTRSSRGSRRCSTSCSSIRSRPTARASRSTRRSRGSASARRRCCDFCRPAAASAIRVSRRSGLVHLDPRWTRRRSLRRARLRAHSRRHRSPAVPVLPRDSVPPNPAARRDRDVVHRGALDHAHRVGGWVSRPTRSGFRRSSRC